MKCKNCGSKVGDGDAFCPVCSAVAPVRNSSKLSKLFAGNDMTSALCLCEILLNVLFVIMCFTKCVIVSDGQTEIGFTLYSLCWSAATHIPVLGIIINAAADVVLARCIIKKSNVPVAVLLVPAATYIFSMIQYAVKLSIVSQTLSDGSGLVYLTVTVIGWILPVICVVAIALMVFILLKRRTRVE